MGVIQNLGIQINDDKGNPLNLPINSQPPTGIYRTFLSGNNSTNIMVKVSDDTGNNYPLGFTPESAYLVNPDIINPNTGYSVEQGNMPTNASIPNNTSVGKISRTNISWTPGNASPLDDSSSHSNQIQFTNYYGNSTPGFTDPLDYITDTSTTNTISGLTGLPKQLGDNPSNIKPNFNKISPVYTTPNIMLKGDGVNITGELNVFNLFNNNQQYNFIHNLDGPLSDGSGQTRRGIDESILETPSIADDIYLGSFIQTSDDNEDPTMFGYDITIKQNSSPLFNGAIISFINQFGNTNDKEIESRRNIWVTFCNQFFKFFGVDLRSNLPYTSAQYGTNFPSNNVNNTTIGTASSSLPQVGISSTGNVAQKVYYLRKISGLDKLVEGDISSVSDSIKTMIDYGKDLITLSIYEDVSVNAGYLAMLYKTLTWSRLNGKQVIPENLLRFDMDISVTEIRNYNRFIKDTNTSGNISVYADNLSKYTYSLYDCQFKFEKLSHGNDIDMNTPKIAEDYDISFNYKYSTLKFDKFGFSGTQSQKYSIDNKNLNVLQPDSVSSNTAYVDSSNSLNTGISSQSLNKIDNWPKNTDTYNTDTSNDVIQSQILNNNQSTVNSYSQKWENYSSQQISNLTGANQNNSIGTLLSSLEKRVVNAVIAQVNGQITTQARLLNNTLNNIRNSVGLGKMSAPTNVYYGNSPLKNDIVNAARDFVGQSLKSFFSPPNQ